MQSAEIYESLTTIVAESLMIEADQVNEDATLESLGAESLDVVEISMEAESKFNVWLPDKSILDTAIDVAGRPAMLEGQQLTGFGKRLFRARLPREQWHLLEGDVTATDLRKYFMRVGTWVRMIEELREHTPTECASCESKELSDKPGFMLVCDSCGHEMKLRSGQDLNREWVERFLTDNGLPAATTATLASPADAETVAQ